MVHGVSRSDCPVGFSILHLRDSAGSQCGFEDLEVERGDSVSEERGAYGFQVGEHVTNQESPPAPQTHFGETLRTIPMVGC